MTAYPAGKLPLHTEVVINECVHGFICGYGRWLTSVRNLKGEYKDGMVSGYLVQLHRGEDFQSQQLYVSTIPVHPENLRKA
jgi:hypothetical protein